MKVAWALAACVFVADLALIALVIRHCDGHFIYTLDDPYIHLSLARQISLGHYGLNPGEASAPSSSFLWPLILALFGHFSWMQFVPVTLDVVFCTASTGVVGLCWSEALDDNEPHYRLKVVGFAAFTILVSNGIALAIGGMEHPLQLLLTNLAALGMIRLIKTGQLPAFLTVSLAIAPLVRYENLALTMAIAVWLFFSGHRRAALVSVGIPCVILIGFSVFLHNLGLGWLPTSILAKTATGWYGWRFVPFVATLALAAFLSRKTKVFPMLAAVAFASLVHDKFGRLGWEQRYEVYLYSFGLIALGFSWPYWSKQLARTAQYVAVPLAALSVVPCLMRSMGVLAMTPRSSGSVYRQQFQTMRFVRDFYREPVAVNDIGAVAFGSGEYVLDLAGLASLDALKAQLSDPGGDWAGSIVAQKRVGLVVIYDDWVPNRPGDWIKVGALKITIPSHAIAENVVSVYAANPAEAPKIKSEFERFEKTLPDGVVGSS